jgi:hypothetical protein
VRDGINGETVRMEARYHLATLSACMFAVLGLIIPLNQGAEGASTIAINKNFKSQSTSSSDCAGQLGGLQSEDGCKSDTKASKVDLDRKGHKVKKSKSRGR